MRMRHIIICGLYGSITFLHIISHTARLSKKNKLLKVKCVFWFSLQILSEPLLILRRHERDMIKMVIGIHVNNPLFLSDFNKTWIFSTGFRKKIPKYKIH